MGLGIRPRDATANRLIVDSVDNGIRQQYPAYRSLTIDMKKWAAREVECAARQMNSTKMV
jgi:hypothetical protein